MSIYLFDYTYYSGIMSYDMEATGDRWWSKASQIVKEDYGKECFHIKFKQKSKFNLILIQIR